MKLSFLIYTYFPFGGLQRDFFRIAKECASRGHEITVYTLRWDGDVPEWINVILVPVSTRNRIKRNEAYTEWVQASLMPAEIVNEDVNDVRLRSTLGECRRRAQRGDEEK